MADRPIACGLAYDTYTALNVSAFHTARAPIKRSREITASTSARSRRHAPPGSRIVTSRHLLLASAREAGMRPVANRPVASPVMVDSRISGNALLVPVDRPTIGTSPHSRTTARWVPSPPSTTIAATPASRMRRAASSVSSTLPATGMSR
ncbi:hypothetical protein BGC_28260 [Burkholderia sp. 3C]